MATSSFFQNVIVEDPAKADEIKLALENNAHSNSDIPPATIDFQKQKEDAERWCSHLKK